MLLYKLSLKSFRNYESQSFNFSPGLTVVVGPNTAGKTNLLEAVYMIATGGSFRAGKGRECIAHSSELARVMCEVRGERWDMEMGSGIEKNNLRVSKHQSAEGANHTSHIPHPTSLELVLTTGLVQGKKAPYKRYLVNGVGRRKSDFIGNFWAVLFNPQDIEIVTDSPGRRRTFLDNVLTQTSREYARALTSYEKALRRRNKILSDAKDSRLKQQARASDFNRNFGERLEYWDKQVIKNGAVVTKKREEFIEFLNNNSKNSITKTYVRASNRKLLEKKLGLRFGFRVFYDNSVINYERLKQYKEKERAAGYTLVGPHRDDFNIIKTRKHENTRTRRQENVKSSKQQSNKASNHQSIKGRELASYGSRGEQRLAVLWLRLGELAYLEEQTGQKPVLLLDDVFSELDHDNRELVENLIPGYQTIVTTADEHYVEDIINAEESDKKSVKLINL